VDYAELLIRLQRFAEAEKQLRALVERYPHDARVNRGMGKLYREQNQYAQAQPYLEDAVKINPGDAEAHFVLGETLRHLGQLEAAKREYAAYRKTKDASRMVRVLELAGSTPAGPFEGN
jgi:tetratricopeptide (TPR) repeat protein